MTISQKLAIELQPTYFKIEFSKEGKRFPCIVKFFEGDRHWICLYYNRDNQNDFFIRKEVMSEILLQHGEKTYPEVFQNLLNKIKNAINE